MYIHLIKLYSLFLLYLPHSLQPVFRDTGHPLNAGRRDSGPTRRVAGRHQVIRGRLFARAAGWHATPTPHTLQSHTRRDRALWQRGRRGRTLVQAAAIGVVHEGHQLAPFVH